ncbi:tetratricopeptide repeat-containing sensor histidine kinase [Winogradskyella sp.]|jgi:signal transduction histidine kinase/tetratricopeptide (TPR) repeat protein|uniref:tetratricopeptide repeat-containing sensor histidine kinase n=1 Tax=Winogradskyella sp. TaxID=1883156 RepID=UPI0025E5DCA0|nr:tetratricopeptide repeat-containing sensor histidine kinase [Winogradskyella sp.]MCT4630255.1 tetratricopeptide repeat-containing sensor histidine kinase [Winogradskyella sp.]
MKQFLILAVCLITFIGFSQNERIDDLTVKLAYQEADSTKVDLSLMLINELYAIKDYKKALRYVNQTAKLSQELKYTKGLAESTYYRALIYAERNDYYNAIDNYDKSRKYYLQISDTLGVAKVSNSIGLIEIKRGNYNIGLQNSLSAIEIFENQNLYDELSTAYSNLAEAYFRTNQIDKAIDFNFKALDINQKINERDGIISSTKNIAELYALRKEHRKAIEYYEKVLKMLNPTKDKNLRGEILPRLGSQYLEFKEYDKAASYLVEGLKYNRKQKNQEGVLLALNAIGNLNLQKRKVKLAEIQLNEAYGIAKKIDNKPALLENYKLHIALDSTRGYFQNAFFWQNKYYDLKEELLKVDQPEFPSEIEPINLNDSNPIEEEMNNFEEEGKEEDTTQAKKTWLNNPLVVYGALASSLILLTLLLLNYLKSNSYRKNLVKQKEKLEQEKIRNEAILEQTHHLEEVNQVKDKLFSIVSHDLKDSISSIKAFIDLLKEDSISKEEFRALIPELSENANNASSLLFNLLNWSKSQMQNLEPNPELFNIQEVFHTKMNLVEQKVEDKRIVLIDESQRDFIYADRSMVEIVIQNLITNAVKFSKTGDVITVSNQDVNGKSLICVEDTGVGISRENIDKLFNANKNFTTVGTKNEKGTGLGLTIAKDLVELNGGKIWVESTLNVGSKFFIELPKAAPQA